ncbi:MAG: DUF1573 domain-containing protein [Mangrovibacterium sp.]
MKVVKNIFLLFILTVSSFNVWAQQSELVFADVKHNFGEIREQDGAVSYTFQFKNGGDAPLILNAVTASCGCTTPVWTKAPIPPGQSGTIEVTFNPLNRPGVFNKTITVNSNANKSQEELYITGKVLAKPKTLEQEYPRPLGEIRAKSNYIRLGDVKNTEIKTGILEVANTSDKAQTITFRTPPSHITVRVDPKTIQPGEKGIISVDFDSRKYANFGNVVSRLYILSDGKASYKNSIGISATVVEDFSTLTPEELANAPIVSFDEVAHDFGRIKQNDKVSHIFHLTNKGKSNLIIRKITTSCGCTAVTPQKKMVAPGETIPLEVKFDSRGKFGRQTKIISVLTNAPSSQVTSLRINTTITE